MSSVDLRTVKMSFDNAEFEKRVGTTLGTLDKLKQSLDFSGATKGMNEIQNNANKINFDALVNGVESLQNRFSVLGEFVHNIFMGMVNTAVEAGQNIANALVLDPIKDGFSEYETQINAIQTILANTESEGVTLNDVNNVLDELNTYADKTIYNFTEMTKNIGTFTAAGVDLETSAKAIQGIANWAAVSGANSEQASRAMYQLSQALAAGKISLQDWNSVVNAGMGGEAIQKAIMDTARVHGIAIDQMMESAGSFRNLLNAKDYGYWLTSDILLESIEKFTAGSEGITQEQLDQMQELYRARGYTEDQIKSLTEAQRVLTEAEIADIKAKWLAKGYTEEEVESIFKFGQTATDAATKVKTFSQLIDTLKEALGSGWTQSWEYIIGDFEQAKELYTEISDILSIYINKSAEARNATLKEWSEGGGRAAIVDALRNSFQALLGVLIPIKQAFDEIFPPIQAKQLIDYSNKLKDFTATLKVTDKQANQIRENAKGVFTIFSIGFTGIINIGKTVKDIFKAIGEAINNAFNMGDILHVEMLVDRFKQFTEAIRPSESTLTNLTKLFTGLFSILRALGNIAIDAASALFDNLGKVFINMTPIGNNFVDLLGVIGDRLTAFAEELEHIFNFESLSGGFGSIAQSLINLWNAISNFLKINEAIDWLKQFFTIPKEGEESVNILKLISEWLGKLANLVAEYTGKIDWGFLDISEIIKSGGLIALFTKLYDILAAILDKIKETSPDVRTGFQQLKDGILEAVKIITDNLLTVQKVLEGFIDSITDVKNAHVFKTIAVSFAILVAALYVLSTIEPKKLISSLMAISVIVVEMVRVIQEVSKLSGTNFTKAIELAGVIAAFGAAVLMISIATKTLSEVDPESLGRGLGGVTVLLIAMYEVVKKLSAIEGDVGKISLVLISFSLSIKVLANAVKSLAALDPVGLSSGVVAVVALMTAMVKVFEELSKQSMDSKTLLGVASAILVFSASMKVLSGIVKAFATLEPEKLAQGLLGLAAIVAMLVYISDNIANNLKNPDKIIKVATALLIFGSSIKVLASIVKDFSNIPWNQLFLGIGGLIAIMASLVAVAQELTSTKINPANMIKTAASLLIIVGTVKTLSDIVIQFSAIPWNQLFIGLGGLAVVVLALAAAAEEFSKESLNPARILEVSGALLVFSAAIGVISLSLKLLSTIPWELLLVSLGALVAMFAIVGGAAVLLGPLAPAILAVSGALTVLGIAVLAFGAGIGIASAGLALFVGAVAASGLSLMEIGRQFLALLGEAGTAFGNFIANLLNTIIERGPEIEEGVHQIFEIIIAALAESSLSLVTYLLETLTLLLERLAEYVPRMAEAGIALLIGFLDAISNNLDRIIDSAFKVIISFIDGLANAIRENHDALYDAVWNLITAVLEAIWDGIVKIGQAAGDWITGPGGVLETVGGFFNNLFEAGANLVQGFINGLLSMPGAIWEAACSIATDAWNAITGTLDEHSPSRLTFGGGVNFVLGFINGILSLKNQASDKAKEIACAVVSTFDDTIKSDYNPTISPVIDYSNMEYDSSRIGNIVDTIPQSVDINENLSNNNTIRKQLIEVISSQQDHSDIINEMNGLREEFINCANMMSRLQIVMDSGVLVGAISQPMDSALGMRQVMVGRGIL